MNMKEVPGKRAEDSPGLFMLQMCVLLEIMGWRKQSHA